ncbi:type IX secretion system plug protein [Adhaeribacter soli]|uniref:DUF5103 domain-containing protein n=1 Tax=Adhaeribacter soli TaxID=2607655 RepID=A0A5N1J513_9BACT|nr:DUF5103 domain-containing protein [Adhaeribacter soli]KAA9346001.1 DUF5103 domain-containing protein [Adhaeribacter soli]
MTFSFRNYTLLASLGMALLGCVPLGEPITGESNTSTVTRSPEYYAKRTLRYEDFIYSDQIKTVQCYAGTGTAEEVLTAPVISIEQGVPVVLEFDELSTDQKRFKVKLVHCDYNWQPSNLADIQFATDYNEYYITDIRPSGNTKVPYFHYRFVVPRVKISGNYLLSVADEDGSYVLTRRIMVYENVVAASLKPTLSAGVGERFSMQQFDINILYPKYSLVNPTQEVKIVLRQNQRWDNAKFNIRPTYVHDAQRRLEYTFFDARNNFFGLNEFRVFDTRSLRYTGFNLASINREADPTEVLLQVQKNRSKEAYARYPEINGKYIIENREYGSGNTEGDYAWVNFQLKADEKAPGDVYVFGQLSEWKLQEQFRMNYEQDKQLYTGRALLKQGYYNFMFALKTGANLPDERYFENSFADTENFYDLLVYYRPPGGRADLLISYVAQHVNSNR